MADPRRLRPADLVRLLNSTRLGEVATPRVVARHRDRAGARISEDGGKTVSFLKYVAWLIQERHAARSPGPSLSSAEKEQGYERHKELAGERQRARTRAGQDIGPIPAPKNLERKAAASASLLTFCSTYFPHRFYLTWSADHREIIGEMERALREGGLLPFAMARASGKTSLCEVACLWATLTGLHSFVLLVGSCRDAAQEMIASIKEELAGNEVLAEDWPEVCYPIACLEDRANRCKGQHSQGKKTRIVWGVDRIVFPTVEGSRASGAVLRVAGITGRIRGAKKETLRPSLVVIDDPQTDASANSLSQCAKRTRIINGAILGLAGPGKKITVIMPCTVIRKGDLADAFLDGDKNPLWKGRRYKLLYAFPKRMDLWEEYATIRADEFRNGGDGSQATAFYTARREEMDLGAVVAWPERHEPDELSAVQHAMNLYAKDKWAFFAEYQNQPLEEDLGDGQLEKDKVAARVSGLALAIVPLRCSRVTAFIDVQQRVLYWLVAAWSDDFTGSVIGYGTWPEQGRQYFTAGDVQRTLARSFPGAGIEAQIVAGLGRCADELLGKVFPREDGTPFRIERLLVDAGFQPDAVKEWCRTTHHAALVMPSHGHGIGASKKPFSEYDRAKCEKFGTHWLIPKAVKKSRHVMIDTNFWKTFVAARLTQAVGDRGALSLYGRTGQDHQMLAEHMTSEYWIETQGRGRKVREWRLRPGQTENHWWDCLVGAAVAASMQGAAILGEKDPPAVKKNNRAEYERKRREFEARRGF